MFRRLLTTLHPRTRLARFRAVRQLESSLDAVRAELETAKVNLDWEVSVSASLAKLYKPLISTDSTIQEMADLVLEQARLLTGSKQGYVATIDRSGGDTHVHTIAKMAGCGADSPHGASQLVLPRNSDGSFSGLRGHSLNTGQAFFTNAAHKHPAFDGYPKWHLQIVRFLSVPVILNGTPAGQIALANPPSDYSARDLAAVERLAGFYVLALQRKETSDITQAALREKEVLLREIHHRVKNNLQVISSLLNLQAGTLENPKALEMLKESQNRVRSMAMVHEQLHRSRNLSRINFREYVRNLTASLFCSYGISSAAVSLNLQLAEACFPIDLAVPCGLIVQELVSNSLKHAFPAGRPGELFIGLDVRGADNNTGAGRWVLVVRDNGVGLPEGVDVRTSGSLGLRLVRILAEQLNASVEYSSKHGTEFRIELTNE